MGEKNRKRDQMLLLLVIFHFISFFGIKTIGGYGDGRGTLGGNKGGMRQREGPRRQREGGEGGGYLKHSRNVAGCDPPMHASGNLRMCREMLRVSAKMRGGAEGGEDSFCQITQSRTGAGEKKADPINKERNP